jgi:hypothetical protein
MRWLILGGLLCLGSSSLPVGASIPVSIDGTDTMVVYLSDQDIDNIIREHNRNLHHHIKRRHIAQRHKRQHYAHKKVIPFFGVFLTREDFRMFLQGTDFRGGGEKRSLR